MAEITEREREIAHAMLNKWRQACLHPQHNTDCTDICQALANHAAEAREAENRQCEKLASAAADMQERTLGYYGPPAAAADALADAIAARRGGHG